MIFLLYINGCVLPKMYILPSDNSVYRFGLGGTMLRLGGLAFWGGLILARWDESIEIDIYTVLIVEDLLYGGFDKRSSPGTTTTPPPHHPHPTTSSPWLIFRTSRAPTNIYR